MNKHKTKLLIAMQLCSILLLTLFVGASASAQTLTGGSITPPPVPDEIKVEPGNEVFLVGHATGTQNYSCLPCDPSKPNCANGVAFKLFTPQATLFNDQGEQITTHFFSPNPSPNPAERGVVRATWEHSRDTSAVWGKVIGSATVRRDSIDWLLIQVKDVGTQAGPTGGDKLTKTTFIQRLRTFGGLAPTSGCDSPADIGRQAFVPYAADYFFYREANGK